MIALLVIATACFCLSNSESLSNTNHRQLQSVATQLAQRRLDHAQRHGQQRCTQTNRSAHILRGTSDKPLPSHKVSSESDKQQIMDMIGKKLESLDQTMEILSEIISNQTQLKQQSSIWLEELKQCKLKCLQHVDGRLSYPGKDADVQSAMNDLIQIIQSIESGKFPHDGPSLCEFDDTILRLQYSMQIPVERLGIRSIVPLLLSEDCARNECELLEEQEWSKLPELNGRCTIQRHEDKDRKWKKQSFKSSLAVVKENQQRNGAIQDGAPPVHVIANDEGNAPEGGCQCVIC